MPTGPPRRNTSPPGSGENERGASSGVRLEVPAEARFARVVRVAVSAAAVHRRLEVSAIEDLRIAVDESLILLLREGAEGSPVDAGPTPERSVTVTINDGVAGLEVDLQLRPRPDGHLASTDDLEALSRFTELVPPRVTVATVDPIAGAIRLHLN